MHARPRQTDRRTDGRTDRRTNIVAIAQRFVLTNASRAKTCFLLWSETTTFCQFFSRCYTRKTVSNRSEIVCSTCMTNALCEGVFDGHERGDEHVSNERRREGKDRHDSDALSLLWGTTLLRMVQSVLGRHDLRQPHVRCQPAVSQPKRLLNFCTQLLRSYCTQLYCTKLLN